MGDHIAPGAHILIDDVQADFPPRPADIDYGKIVLINGNNLSGNPIHISFLLHPFPEISVSVRRSAELLPRQRGRFVVPTPLHSGQGQARYPGRDELQR